MSLILVARSVLVTRRSLHVFQLLFSADARHQTGEGMRKQAGYWRTMAVAGLALLFAVFAATTGAQSVRHEGLPFGYGASVKRFQREAEKQGYTRWPLPNLWNGTQVRITFDAHNADITLMTPREFGEAALLAEARRITKALDAPKTDYIVIEGRRTIAVDMEFNKYLRRDGNRAAYAFDLSTLAIALKQSRLPAPIGIGADTEEATSAVLQTATQGSRTLTGYWFATPNDIAPQTRLTMRAEPAWYAYPVMIGFLCLFLLPIALPWRIVFAKRKLPETPSPDKETPVPTPEEVQQKYDRKKPQWIMILLPLLLLLLVRFLLFMVVDPKRLMLSMMMVMPISLHLLAPALIGAMVISSGAAALVGKMRARRNPDAVKETVTPEMESARVMRLPLLIMGGMTMVMMMVMMLITGWSIAVPPPNVEAWQVRRNIMFGVLTTMGVVMGIVLVSMLFLMRRMMRGLRTPLTEGPVYDMVQEIASRTGVTVKRVDLLKSSSVNGFASLTGTVTLTTGLVEKMEPAEIRVIVAHELAHLKCGHVRRSFLLSLGSLIVVGGLWFALRTWAQHHFSENAHIALSTPLFFILGANLLLAWLLGPGRRKREEEADRMALTWTGDPELVIHTLTKLHTLNAMPHRLKPSDEALSAHPSLTHRIEAIRKRAAAEQELDAAPDLPDLH
jgi:Zn-dependent protease with chaperone function